MLQRILQASAIAGGVALGWHLLSRTGRQLALKNHLTVAVSHVRITRISWTGDVDVVVGVRLQNPTKGTIQISHPTILVQECRGGSCESQVGISEPTGRQYQIPAEGVLQLEDTRLKLSLRSQLANLTRIGELIQAYQQTGKLGLQYRLLVKTNVPGLGLIQTTKEVQL